MPGFCRGVDLSGVAAMGGVSFFNIAIESAEVGRCQAAKDGPGADSLRADTSALRGVRPLGGRRLLRCCVHCSQH